MVTLYRLISALIPARISSKASSSPAETTRTFVWRSATRPASAWRVPELRKAVGGEHLRVHGVERRRGAVDLAEQLPVALLEPGERLALRLGRAGGQRVPGEEAVHPVRPHGVALDQGDERVRLLCDVVQWEGRVPHRLPDRVGRGEAPAWSLRAIAGGPEPPAGVGGRPGL